MQHDILQDATAITEKAFKIARRIAREAADAEEATGYDRALAGALTGAIVMLFIEFRREPVASNRT